MTDNLFIIKDQDLLVGTWKLSKGFNIEHRSLKTLIRRFKKDFTDVGEREIETRRLSHISNVDISQKKRTRVMGRPVEEYLLDEPQATFLGTLLRNNPQATKFKKHLTSEFYRQRKELHKFLSLTAFQIQNAEWLEKRVSGKIERRRQTDIIQAFVEYAKHQGSQNAEKYYMIITKMENQTLFYLDFLKMEFPNLRDVVDGFALDLLKMADHAIGRALKEGMDQLLPYKECYQLAKLRVETLVSVIGKTPLQRALGEDKVTAIRDQVPLHRGCKGSEAVETK